MDKTQFVSLLFLLLFLCFLIFRAWPIAWPRSPYRVGMLVGARVSIPTGGCHIVPVLLTRHNRGVINNSRYDGTVLKVENKKIVVSTYIYGLQENNLEVIKGLE